MPQPKDIPAWNPDNIFTGTARYYALYRPGYPGAVIRLLADKFRLSKSTRVLDLGCGTGQAALSLSPLVAEVVAVDPQEDMLCEGKKIAAERSINNITWLKGESGKLKELAPLVGEIQLTVIARAFHWMDRQQTLADLYRITRPGGGVAIIADSSVFEESELPWKQAVVQTVQKWLGAERKAGTEGVFHHPAKTFESYLNESRFGNFTAAELKTERTWTVDEIIGYMLSTSMASPPVLKDKKEPFEEDLRQSLLEIVPDGRFIEPVTIKVMMVWK